MLLESLPLHEAAEWYRQCQKKSTMNRQIRIIVLKAFDFATMKEQLIDDAELKTNAVKNVTPRSCANPFAW